MTATDSAAAPADVATVTIGYLIYAPDAQTIYANGSQISNSVIKALLEAGVPKTAIESEQQRLQQPQQGYNSEKIDPARRFMLSQSWTVRTTADAVSKVLDIAVKAGANDSGQIEWSLADDNALEGKAAAKALERARAIATNMAAGLGAKLGQLVYASNESPERGGRGYGMGMGGSSAVIMAKTATPPPSPLAITGKQIEKSATVYAVFSIE